MSIRYSLHILIHSAADIVETLPIWGNLLTFTSTVEPRTPCRIFLWWHLFKSLHNIKQERSRASFFLDYLHIPIFSQCKEIFVSPMAERASLSAVGIFQLHERASLEMISTLTLKKKEKKWNDGDSPNRQFCFLFSWLYVMGY